MCYQSSKRKGFFLPPQRFFSAAESCCGSPPHCCGKLRSRLQHAFCTYNSFLADCYRIECFKALPFSPTPRAYNLLGFIALIFTSVKFRARPLYHAHATYNTPPDFAQQHFTPYVFKITAVPCPASIPSPPPFSPGIPSSSRQAHIGRFLAPTSSVCRSLFPGHHGVLRLRRHCMAPVVKMVAAKMHAYGIRGGRPV